MGFSSFFFFFWLWVKLGAGGASARAVVTYTQINGIGSLGNSVFNSVSVLFIASFQKILMF